MTTEIRHAATLLTRIGEGGRLVIPAEHRRALGLKTGDAVIVALEADGLRITTRRAALARARRLLREVIPEGVSLVDELLADRRREAANE
jgi:AbrB family looped-hinge helix DNA binding protein